MAEAERVNLETMDIAEEKREQLKSVFPEAFAEGKVDFDQLKRSLGEWVEPAKERFGLNWPGKADCMKIIQQPSVSTLKPARDESVNFDDTENLFIEGDNLEVLKLLQKSYFGKVKMIYVDPPYNTGNEFIYPDKFAETLDTYLEYTGQKDGEGKKLSTNSDTNGRYHSRWLNMMYPRLYLAKNLLKDDGMIFISIDDREVAHLRELCDIVFGEENFVATFLWKKKSTTTNVEGAKVSSLTEYIVCYQRYESGLNYRVTSKESRIYPFEGETGKYRKAVIEKKNEGSYARQTMKFKIIGQEPREGKRWQIGERKARELESKNRFILEDGIVKLKIYDFEDKDTTSANPNLLFEHGSTDSATKALNQIMGITGLFDNPKPVELISQLIEYSQSGEKDDIILDFFAGSGTTAHAVMESNKKDKGKRSFICIQLPELIDEKSPALAAGYKTIADLSKERIRRAGKKIEEEQNDQLDFNSEGKLDLGFKVFKLSSSNFKVWEGDVEQVENLEQQLFDHVDHINDASSPEDILYELLLKSGFTLSTQVEKLQLAGKDVFSIAEGALLICLEKELTQEVIDAIADADPLQVICLDDGFKGNDQLKANAVQTFKARAQEDKDHEIVFRTV